MIFLLRAVSASYVRWHMGQALLTVLGVTIGVATFASMRAVRMALSDGLRTTVDRVAGKAQLQITGTGGVPEALQEAVRGVDGVRALGPAIEQVVSVEADGSALLVLAVDLLADRRLRDYRFSGDNADLDDPLVFLAQPDSVALTTEGARRHGLRLGDRLVVRIRGERKTLIVRALLRGEGLAEAFGGNLAVTDVYAAQDLFGRGRRFDRLDVVIDDDVAVGEAAARLQRTAGPAFDVATPERRGAEMDRLIADFSVSLEAASVLALVVGGFLVFNTVAVSVDRRRRDIAILRAIGATPAQVQTLFLIEAAIIGAAGGALGLTAGAGLAGPFLADAAQSVEAGWGLASSDRASLDPALTLQSMLMGIAVSVAAAWLPARAAGRVPPAVTLAGTRIMTIPPPRSRARVLAGLGLLACAIAAAVTRPLPGAVLVPLTLAAAVAAVSMASGPAAAWLLARAAPAIAAVAPVSGRLAADALGAHLRRATATTAAMTLSIAFVIGTSGYFASLTHALGRWAERMVTAEVVVRASPTLGPSAMRLPASAAGEIGRVAGVASVEGYRADRVRFRDGYATLVALDAEGIRRRSRQEFVHGDEGSFVRGLVDEGKCAVSSNFARRYGLGAGDAIELSSPSGPVVLRIAAVVTAFQSRSGSIMIDRSRFIAAWNDDRVDMIHVNPSAGIDPRHLRDVIRSRLAGRVPALVSTREEFLREIQSAFEGFNTLTRVAVLVALLVAFMGTAASLLISVAQRTREIGILKALGAAPAQIHRSIVSEALVSTACAAAIALPLAALLARFLSTTVVETYAGLQLPAVVPAATLAQLGLTLPAVAACAAWLPAWRAGRVRTVEAISYE